MTSASTPAPAFKPLKRTGLHRLMCAEDCGQAVYMTLTQVERGPLPTCGCGALLLPEHPELARRVLPEPLWGFHPWLREFDRARGFVARGQSSHVQRGREVRSPEEIAGDRVYGALAADARTRQLAGLRQHTNAARVVAEMAF